MPDLGAGLLLWSSMQVPKLSPNIDVLLDIANVNASSQSQGGFIVLTCVQVWKMKPICVSWFLQVTIENPWVSLKGLHCS